MKKLRSIILSIIAAIAFWSCDQNVDLPEVIEFYEPDYSALWMVGNAVPAGWNIDAPTPMVVNPEDPFEFTWQGEMTPGMFKIPTETGNWGCDYYMPTTDGEDVSGDIDVKLIPGGSPDNKWVVSETGTYKVTLNIKPPGAISIEKL